MKKTPLLFARSLAAAALLIPALGAQAAAPAKPLARAGDVTVQKAKMPRTWTRSPAAAPG